MEHDLRTLQSKVIQAAKRRDETLRRQFTRAQALIFPLGQPQERTLTMVYLRESVRSRRSSIVCCADCRSTGPALDLTV